MRRRNLTDEELMEEVNALDEAYTNAAAYDAKAAEQREAALAEYIEKRGDVEPEDEQEEPFDPIAFGWVDHRGRP